MTKYEVSFTLPGAVTRKVEVEIEVDSLDLSKEMIPGTKAKGVAVNRAIGVLRREGIRTWTLAGVTTN